MLAVCGLSYSFSENVRIGEMGEHNSRRERNCTVHSVHSSSHRKGAICSFEVCIGKSRIESVHSFDQFKEQATQSNTISSNDRDSVPLPFSLQAVVITSLCSHQY